MCCYNCPACIDSLKNKYKDKEWVVFWKTINKDGRSSVMNFDYTPGIHHRQVKSYNENRPRGFHVYLTKETARELKENSSDEIIPVYCNMNTLIAADEDEAVFSTIKILKKDWDNANFIIKTKHNEWVKLYWATNLSRLKRTKAGINNNNNGYECIKQCDELDYSGFDDVFIPVLCNMKYFMKIENDCWFFKQIKISAKDLNDGLQDICIGE